MQILNFLHDKNCCASLEALSKKTSMSQQISKKDPSYGLYAGAYLDDAYTLALLNVIEERKMFPGFEKHTGFLKAYLSERRKAFFASTSTEITKLGFDFDHFGGNSFVLRAVPIIMGRTPNLHIIKEIISDITDIGKDKSFSDKLEEIINYLACHKSIRGGDDMSLQSIRKLIIDLASCKDSFHCAHGRPTLKFFSFKELDRLFKRTV